LSWVGIRKFSEKINVVLMEFYGPKENDAWKKPEVKILVALSL
jgi:hypothetical protein